MGLPPCDQHRGRRCVRPGHAEEPPGSHRQGHEGCARRRSRDVRGGPPPQGFGAAAHEGGSPCCHRSPRTPPRGLCVFPGSWWCRPVTCRPVSSPSRTDSSSKHNKGELLGDRARFGKRKDPSSVFTGREPVRVRQCWQRARAAEAQGPGDEGPTEPRLPGSLRRDGHLQEPRRMLTAGTPPARPLRGRRTVG